MHLSMFLAPGFPQNDRNTAEISWRLIQDPVVYVLGVH